MKTSLKYILFTASLILTSSLVFGQNFEGWITYKIEAQNPNPEMVPDSIWQQQMKSVFGERGFMLNTSYYKEGKYISEIDAGKQLGFQAYNPSDGLLYSWQAHSDTAMTLDSKKYMDPFVEITVSNETDTVLGIPCQGIIVKSKLIETTIWYNGEHFKMDATFYEGHIYGHWEQVLEKTGCIPLKIEQRGFMAHSIQTATSYKQEKVKNRKFKIPEFKTIIANPVN